jgi:hypothetical protein
MKAESFIENPPQTLQDVIAEVQEAANHTQSEAWHIHAAGDGSVVEIRCAPEPKYRGELPEITEDNDGFLAEKNGKLYKAVPVEVERSEDAQNLARKLGDGEGYRTIYSLAPQVQGPRVNEDGTLDTDGPPETTQEFAVVEFEWQEVDPKWKEHALKKSADVRLTAHKSQAVAGKLSGR